MSNKDVRKPAPGAGEEFRKKHEELFEKAKDIPKDPDLEFLDSIPPEKRKLWVKAGHRVRDAFQAYFIPTEEVINDNDAMSALDACTHFLKQLVQITSWVIQSVDMGAMRELVAAELPLPREMRVSLKAAGIDVSEIKPNIEESGDWRKRPRGSRHPLIVLINFSLQASRLLQKITAGTNPRSQNLPTLEDKEAEKRAASWGLEDLPG